MTISLKTTPVPVILCADDFGISSGVDRAIIDLAAKGRLSAVTCMSLGDAWAEDAPLLKACNIAAGLHITLTYLPPLVKEIGARHPSEIMVGAKSWLRILDKVLVEQEIRAQFLRFIEFWGAPPDFIDGHQHVHVLPIVRDIVLRLRQEYAPHAWVRDICDFSDLGNAKSLKLAVMGFRFQRMLKARGIPCSPRMRGPYDYVPDADFPKLMAQWCTGEEPVLIYCHPGFPDAGLARHDKVLEPRQREYDFLNGDVFGDWIGTKITLEKFPTQTAPRHGAWHQTLRFIGVGGINTVFAYLVYAFMAGVLDMGAQRALLLSWMVSVTFSYLTFRLFVFTDGDRSFKTYLRFIPLYAALLAINALALTVLVDMAGWNKLVAQAVIVPCCAALSFIANRAFVFRKTGDRA